jgi:hypothetical protein
VPGSYYDSYEIGFAATAQQLVVDWGDGSAAETYTNVYLGDWDYHDWDCITHTYSGNGTYTVQIKGEGLTVFVYHSGIVSMNISGCAALHSLYSDCLNSYSLTISNCAALERLRCSTTNGLTSLTISGCAAFYDLWCANNKLTSLDVSKCTALQTLWCGNNQLTALDVSKCPMLEMLDCESNQLTTLDISKCPMLQELHCRERLLTSLDVSKCTALQGLDCAGNQLTATALNTVFMALPNRTAADDYGSIYITFNPGSNTCNRAIAENKGWHVY